MPGVQGILLIGVPIYSIILTTMLWRAMSRVQIVEVINTIVNEID